MITFGYPEDFARQTYQFVFRKMKQIANIPARKKHTLWKYVVFRRYHFDPSRCWLYLLGSNCFGGIQLMKGIGELK
jgi:hypothetical protein